MIVSEDYGLTWDFVELVGFPEDSYLNSISIIPETNEILLNTTNHSVFRADIAELVSVHQVTVIPCAEIANYPNPFNPETKIVFNLIESGNAKLEIYNIKGQKIKTLIKDQLSTGQHSVVWDGRDDNGKAVSSGVYFYKLQTPSKSYFRKCILLK